MKKLFLVFGIVLSCTTVHAGPYDWEQTMTGDSLTVSVSSNPSAPTQILTKDSYVQRTWIVNSSVFTIFIGSSNVNISTNTSFGIPAAPALGPATIWSPDGTNAPYEGAMYAVSTGTATLPKISIFRSK